MTAESAWIDYFKENPHGDKASFISGYIKAEAKFRAAWTQELEKPITLSIADFERFMEIMEDDSPLPEEIVERFRKAKLKLNEVRHA
jgi:hypothetical protein